MPRRPRFRTAAVATAGLLLLGGAAAPAYAHATTPAPLFTQVEQVSDQPERGAALTDPGVINPWGLALTPTSPLWVVNDGSGTATLYGGGLDGAPVTKAAITVALPGAPATGEVFNDTTDFVVTGPGGSGAARFMFTNVAGDIMAWNPTATPGTAVTVAHVEGASYTGLTLLHTELGAFLLAADFHNNRIDVFDGAFFRVPLPASFFHDARVPAGFAAFNVQAIGDSVYVTYAQPDPTTGLPTKATGLGFVDVYTDFGATLRRIATRSVLNAPWGIAVAPASFGRFAGDLLVGNFGDGRINVYQGSRFLGQLRGTDGQPVTIDGLWALLPGTATTGGTGTVWYSAGPDNEQHGLVGELMPAPTTS